MGYYPYSKIFKFRAKDGLRYSNARSVNTTMNAATLNVEKLAAGENVLIASDGYEPVNVDVR